MNLFYLDLDPAKNAEYHVDKHIVKMPLETAQILCTTHWISAIIGPAPRHLNSQELKELRAAVAMQACKNIPYKPTHPNHPSVIWARTNCANYDWVLGYLLALGDEYTYRYDKEHLAVRKCMELDCLVLPETSSMSPFALAMPDKYKSDDPIASYRAYYTGDKAHLAGWKYRETPKWFLTKTT
jgi:hypothetical protein